MCIYIYVYIYIYILLLKYVSCSFLAFRTAVRSFGPSGKPPLRSGAAARCAS